MFEFWKKYFWDKYIGWVCVLIVLFIWLPLTSYKPTTNSLEEDKMKITQNGKEYEIGKFKSNHCPACGTCNVDYTKDQIDDGYISWKAVCLNCNLNYAEIENVTPSEQSIVCDDNKTCHIEQGRNWKE